MLWLANGRIAGISGIVGGLWTAHTGDIAWSIPFVIGLIAAPVLYSMAGGQVPHITVSVPWPLIMIGGLLVGFGTRLGGGCTSGHDGLRYCPVLATLARGDRIVHGDSYRNQLHPASSDRALT